MVIPDQSITSIARQTTKRLLFDSLSVDGDAGVTLKIWCTYITASGSRLYIQETNKKNSGRVWRFTPKQHLDPQHFRTNLKVFWSNNALR
jgi:hypothetical protein